MDPIIGPQIEAAPPSIKTVHIKNVVAVQGVVSQQIPCQELGRCQPVKRSLRQ